MLSDPAGDKMGKILFRNSPIRPKKTKLVEDCTSTRNIAVGWKSPAKKLYRTESVFIKKVVLAADFE